MSPVAAFTRVDTSLPEELDEVFRAHARLVYRTAYSVTGSPQDAEDVVQNLFLQLLRRGLPPDFRKNPKAYLYRAAVNLGVERRQVASAPHLGDRSGDSGTASWNRPRTAC